MTPGADGGPATPPDPPATGPLRWEEVAPGAAGEPAEPVAGSGTAPGRTALLAGHGIALAGVAALVATLLAAGSGLKSPELMSSWQTLRPSELAADPLGSVWYLHVQPPLHNLVVGSVLRWSPFPEMGSLFALYAACLALIAVLLVDLLRRWGVHPVAAGAVTVVALSNPNLLSTIGVASYEVPVTALLVASIWAFQLHVERSSGATLVLLAALLTATALTRSLFHPVWILAVLTLAVLARPVARRAVAVAVAVPLVLVGGWMLKNQVLFGEATTSSWLGFNLQRGVVATFERAEVEEAVDDGTVSDLALEYPWGTLDAYGERVGDCEPDHGHPVVADPVKGTVGSVEVANFNHECYLPLYEESRANATALVRRDPLRYLSTRPEVLASSFAMAKVGFEDPVVSPAGTRQPSRTWMDAAGDVWLVPVDAHISQEGWNLPLLGGDGGVLDYRFSLTLAGLGLVVLARGTWAVVVLARRGWDHRETWDAVELTWVVVAATGVLVVVVGDLLEYGENGRFRSMLDPLLVALPLGLLVRSVQARLAARRRPGGVRAPRPTPRRTA